jgi:quercetin dioxygenase-like cupin family protein
MGRVRVSDDSTKDFRVIRDLVGADDRAKFSAAELDSKICFIEPGGAAALQLFEIDYLPGAVIDVHAHDEDEIIYIVSGEMHLGDRVLGAGGTVFIAGNTLYGFKAGPQGLRMLNFRPRADMSFVTRDQFLARRLHRTRREPGA